MFMNHSCAPTCWFEPDELYKNDGVVVMTATRDLVPGDELTFDYATSEDVEQNWKCLCGEPTCRGRVTSDDWKDPAFQAKYRGHCMPHVEVREDTNRHFAAYPNRRFVSADVPTSAPRHPSRIVQALMANAANDAALGLFAFADLRRSGEIGGAFWSPEDVAKAGRAKLPEAFWSAEKCREEASNVAAQVPLAIKTPPPGPDSWGRHLVYLPEQDGEEAMAAPIVAGQTVMLMPPNLLLRDRQMKGRRGYMGTLYNAALQVRPSAQRPGALYSLSETPEDLDNYINHSCDPNCDVEVFPTNYLIKLTANRDIFPGEPVTIDYETTEEDMVAQGDQFECECGSENCRGRILGWKYRAARGPIAIPLKVGAEVDSPAVTEPARPGVLQPLVEPVSATA